MLGHLVSKAPQLIRPYIQPILAVLIPKLKEPDQNLGVVVSVLTAVGDIALVCESLFFDTCQASRQPSDAIVAIYYYYSARKLILIYLPTEG